MFGTDTLDTTKNLRGQLANLCAELDPNTMPLNDVPAVFDELVAIKKLAEGAVLRMTARYEEAGRWKADGAKDFEDDLARKTGSTRGEARAAAKTSRRLKQRPKTDDAVRHGRLSQEQADAVAAGADVSPDDEDALLESAGRDPMHELKKKAAHARARADRDREATRRRQHKMRCYRQWTDEDGMSNHLLRLPPDRGAEVDAKLAGDIDRAFADARAVGRYESRDAYAADVVYDLLTGRRTSRYTERTRTGGDWRGTDSPATSPSDAGRHTGANVQSDPDGQPDRDRAESLFPDLDSAKNSEVAGRESQDSARSDSQGPPSDATEPRSRSNADPRPPATGTGSPPGTDPPPAIDQSPGTDRSPTGTTPARQSVGSATNPPDDEQRLPARKSNQAVRPERKVLVNIDIAALNRGATEPGEICDIAGVGSVSVPVVRAMMADAFVALVIKEGRDIRNITHLGRQVTAHQRTALEGRGYKCEVEGCAATHHLEIDHITGWTLTQTTTVDDLAWLCRHHHDRKTLENLILTGPPGHRRLAPPNASAAA